MVTFRELNAAAAKWLEIYLSFFEKKAKFVCVIAFTKKSNAIF